MGPDTEMMAPVERIRRFMQTGDVADLADAFEPRGAVIIENFPPYLFAGDEVVSRWRDGFRTHAASHQLEQLQAEFGPAEDFDRRDPDLAFFTLPTRWTGRSDGRAFSETGGWAFVLVRVSGAWRVRSYAWAVVERS